MNLFSGLFPGKPTWHQSLPAHVQFKNSALINALEALRRELDLDENIFVIVFLSSKTVMIRNLILSYNELRRLQPG